MKTLRIPAAVAIALAVLVTACKKRTTTESNELKQVVSVVHMLNVAGATPAPPSDTSKTIARRQMETPDAFKERAEKKLIEKGYKLMDCCRCAGSGSGCCSCNPFPDKASSSYEFVAPLEYKNARLIPAGGGPAIDMKPTSMEDMTMFLLDQKVENGQYRFELQGAETIYMNVVAEDGILRVDGNSPDR